MAIFRNKKGVCEQKSSGDIAINERFYRHVRGIEIQPSVEFRNEFLGICCREVYVLNAERCSNEKAQSLSWFGHMHGMANERMATKLY